MELCFLVFILTGQGQPCRQGHDGEQGHGGVRGGGERGEPCRIWKKGIFYHITRLREGKGYCYFSRLLDSYSARVTSDQIPCSTIVTLAE